MLFRGLTAALMGQPAAGIEMRHPHLTRTAKAALQPLLGFPPISTRMHEVTDASTASTGPTAVPHHPFNLPACALLMCLRSCFAIWMRSMCRTQVWQAWEVVAPVKPQLYLSSQADALIPPAEINLFKLQQVG